MLERVAIYQFYKWWPQANVTWFIFLWLLWLLKCLHFLLQTKTLKQLLSSYDQTGFCRSFTVTVIKWNARQLSSLYSRLERNDELRFVLANLIKIMDWIWTFQTLAFWSSSRRIHKDTYTLGVSDFHNVESWSTPGVKEFLRPQLILHFKKFLQEAKVLERKKWHSYYSIQCTALYIIWITSGVPIFHDPLGNS